MSTLQSRDSNPKTAWKESKLELYQYEELCYDIKFMYGENTSHKFILVFRDKVTNYLQTILCVGEHPMK